MGEIRDMMSRINVNISHTFREGNSLVDRIANYTLDSGPIECQCFEELDTQGTRMVDSDKMQCPYIRVSVAR